MRKPTCPRLKILSHILMTAYSRRSDAVAEENPFQIARADENLMNVHKLISEHRSNCPNCEAIEVGVREDDQQLPLSLRIFWKMDKAG